MILLLRRTLLYESSSSILGKVAHHLVSSNQCLLQPICRFSIRTPGTLAPEIGVRAIAPPFFSFSTFADHFRPKFTPASTFRNVALSVTRPVVLRDSDATFGAMIWVSLLRKYSCKSAEMWKRRWFNCAHRSKPRLSANQSIDKTRKVRFRSGFIKRRLLYYISGGYWFMIIETRETQGPDLSVWYMQSPTYPIFTVLQEL